MIFTERGFKKLLEEVMYGKEKAYEKFESMKKEIEVLSVELKDLEIRKEKDIERIKSELASLQSKKKIEEEEIKHLIKMKEEKLLLDISRKDVELQKVYTQREMDLQNIYHDKVLATIEESRRESKDLYAQIMARLPNVNLEINKELK